MRRRRPKVLFVGRGVLAGGRGRWLAVLASVAVSAGIIYAEGDEDKPSPPCCPSTVQDPTMAAGPQPLPPPRLPEPVLFPSGPQVATQAEVDLLAANAPTTAQQFQLELPPGVAPEQGLQVKTIWAARAIGVLFPEVTTIGGFRQDALRWHPSGMAIDVMIPDYHSPAGIQLGDQIAGMALANAKRWGVLHVIWRQRIYPGIGPPSWTEDYGNETLNHYDHVHIATDGGGYPTGQETYYIGSMNPNPPD